MERGADICRGKLAGAAGSSQPRARSLPARRRGKQTLRACELRLLTSAFFLNIPPRSGSEELSCRKSKCTKQSQQEIHILPKARAKWDHRAASSRSGCGGGAVGLCEANLGSNRSKGCLYGPDLQHTEIKGRAQLGFKEGPQTLPLSVLFSECVQKIKWEQSPWKVIPCSSAVVLCGSRYFEKYLRDLPVRCSFIPPAFSNWVHPFLFILIVNKWSAKINNIPPLH